MAEVLRPMSTGELMDRTFGLYKKNFWLFVGIASLGPATYLLFQLLTVGSASLQAGNPNRISPFSAASLGIGFAAGFLTMLVGMAIAHAATVRAVASVHLGLPITIVDAYKSLRGSIWRVLGVFIVMLLLAGLAALGASLIIVVIVLMARFMSIGSGPIAASREAQIVSAFLGFFAAIGVVLCAMIVWVRYALAVACCVVEHLGVIKSIKRSSVLSKGSRFRIFLIYVVFVLLSVVAGAMLGGLAGGIGIVIPYLPARLILLYLASFIAGSVTSPLATIGIALAYYDERVRKEAFDLQFMMSSLDSPAPLPGAAVSVQP
jgi:hypothetical protein